MPGLETRALVLGEPVDVALAVRGQDEQAARSEDAAELIAPRSLRLLGKVREDGDRGDRAEPLVGVREGRLEPMPLEACEGQVLPAPPDRLGVVVAAVQVGAAFPVPDDAPAAAAEVEQALRRAVPLENLGDRRRGQPPALEEPVRIRGSGDADAKAGRR